MSSAPQASQPLALDNRQKILQMLQHDTFKKQLTAALMDRIPPDFMLRCAVATLNSDAKLQKCEPVTVAASILQLAQAGLAPEVFKGQAYLIPRSMKRKDSSGKEYWRDECTALIGYRGYVTLSYRSQRVVRAHAFPVFEGDIFEINLGAGEPPLHKPWIRPEPGREKRGNLIGAYALVKMDNGEYLVDYMTKEDIDRIRERSKAGDKGPWVTDYVEMARKTPFRRLFKWVPDEKLQQVAAMEEAVELGKTTATIDAATGEIVISVEEEREENHISRAKPVEQYPGAALADSSTGAMPSGHAPSEGSGSVHGRSAMGAGDEAKATDAVAGSPQVGVGPQGEVQPEAHGKKGVSEARIKRLFAILHAGQKAATEAERKAAEQKLHDYLKTKHGIDSVKQITDEMYDAVCQWAGGEQLKLV